METAKTSRRQRIEAALLHAIAEQRATRIDELDVGKLAAAVVGALLDDAAPSPIDPEEDGLTPKELNAANDV